MLATALPVIRRASASRGLPRSGVALAGVFQIIISEAGQRTREGQSQPEIANELHPIVENVLDELGRWLSV
jgi:hypothetical protein